jgi:hypothetical protein
VGIRHFTYEDGAEFTARARESKDLHHPWLFPPTTTQAYTAYAGRLIEDPSKAGFLVCEKSDGAIGGFININNIVEGGFQSGALGYGAFAHAAGRGLMREGLDLVDRPGPRLRVPPGGLLAEDALRRRGLARPRTLGDHHRDDHPAEAALSPGAAHAWRSTYS